MRKEALQKSTTRETDIGHVTSHSLRVISNYLQAVLELHGGLHGLLQPLHSFSPALVEVLPRRIHLARDDKDGAIFHLFIFPK